jgi:hypothetical protein
MSEYFSVDALDVRRSPRLFKIGDVATVTNPDYLRLFDIGNPNCPHRLFSELKPGPFGELSLRVTGVRLWRDERTGELEQYLFFKECPAYRCPFPIKIQDTNGHGRPFHSSLFR